MNAEMMEKIRAFLYREARLLDEERWDEWLECYDERASFWMPAWDDDDTLTEDPQREISLIYYPDRSGLEDRVFRIKTDRSSATIPDTRTSHNISNIELESQDGDVVTVRFNWHTLSHRYQSNYTHFGFSRYVIDLAADTATADTKNTPKIMSKYVVLKNDYIHHVIDIYHI